MPAHRRRCRDHVGRRPPLRRRRRVDVSHCRVDVSHSSTRFPTPYIDKPPFAVPSRERLFITNSPDVRAAAVHDTRCRRRATERQVAEIVLAYGRCRGQQFASSDYVKRACLVSAIDFGDLPTNCISACGNLRGRNVIARAQGVVVAMWRPSTGRQASTPWSSVVPAHDAGPRTCRGRRHAAAPSPRSRPCAIADPGLRPRAAADVPERRRHWRNRLHRDRGPPSAARPWRPPAHEYLEAPARRRTRRVPRVDYRAGRHPRLAACESSSEPTRPELVIHLAGQRQPDLAERQVGETISANVFGTMSVLAAAGRAGRAPPWSPPRPARRCASTPRRSTRRRRSWASTSSRRPRADGGSPARPSASPTWWTTPSSTAGFGAGPGQANRSACTRPGIGFYAQSAREAAQLLAVAARAMHALARACSHCPTSDGPTICCRLARDVVERRRQAPPASRSRATSPGTRTAFSRNLRPSPGRRVAPLQRPRGRTRQSARSSGSSRASRLHTGRRSVHRRRTRCRWSAVGGTRPTQTHVRHALHEASVRCSWSELRPLDAERARRRSAVGLRKRGRGSRTRIRLSSTC